AAGTAPDSALHAPPHHLLPKTATRRSGPTGQPAAPRRVNKCCLVPSYYLLLRPCVSLIHYIRVMSHATVRNTFCERKLLAACRTGLRIVPATPEQPARPVRFWLFPVRVFLRGFLKALQFLSQRHQRAVIQRLDRALAAAHDL